MVLFAAGHETTANSLAWSCHLLSNHPAAVAGIREEAAAVISDPTTAPTPAQLGRLTFLNQVIDESMRLYPPAWITDRIALEDDMIGDIKVSKGTVVAPFIFGVHRSPLLYDRPELFRPERMAAARQAERHPYAFLPFGGGQRMCIGAHFARWEMQLVLLNWVRRFDFLPEVPAGEVRPRAYITVRPWRKLWLGVREI